jgi:hypothetical protein
MSNSESEDEAPSAVSFQQSKIDHENFDNQVRDFLKDRRVGIKEKRRIKEESLKVQKEEKLKRDAEKGDPGSETSGMTTQQKYQHQKRFLPAGIVSSLRDEAVEDKKEMGAAGSRLVGDSSDEEESGAAVRVKPRRMKRKIYEKFNIRVEALGQLENKRIASAVDFKTRRMGKVHRESVDKNRMHQEKLIAAGQHLISK